MARAPFMVSPLWNDRGQMYSGTYTNGNSESCQQPSGVGADTMPRCIHFGSNANWFAYERPKYRRSAWHGSLIEDRVEESGILYRRNRYYDPEKGKFTQEDPIGLAGGVNLYGFADADPVNYGDPFGLCPIPPTNCADVAMAARSVAKFVDAPSFITGLEAAADVGGALPGVPSVGVIRRVAASAVRVTQRYRRPTNAVTAAQRASVQNKACVTCGATEGKRVADHKTPLVREYYETGSIDEAQMRRVDAVQPQCATCSARQGAELSRYSRKKRAENDLPED